MPSETGERRNFVVHLPLAQAALGLHKGGLLSSQLCCALRAGLGCHGPWAPSPGPQSWHWLG